MNDYIASALNSKSLPIICWLVPLGVLFAGIYNIFQFWNIETKISTIARTGFSRHFIDCSVRSFSNGVCLLLGN